MKFSRLRLNGFKSFIDPTDLIIAEGLTGVVGPNGCGKSNLLEALRWVMGENRPTAVRGDGMEDVIFNGTALRPARNFAEVAIHIDNSERSAPSGFNDADQLEIIRRITRDVGSAFRVNSKDARARDVQMLFADASTGAHSPALVRQGQIAELINAKPRERRQILEEAAGISGLYQRRHEAELKLKASSTNLQRVDDVIEQLAAQLAQLARQEKQAERYRKIGEALRQAEGILLYRRWREAEDARAAADEALRGHTQDAGVAERGAMEATKRREECDSALPPLREAQSKAAAALQRLMVERDTLADRETRATQAIETLTSSIAQLAKDIEREEALSHDAGETIARLQAEAEELKTAGLGHGGDLETAADAAHKAAAQLKQDEEALSQLTEDTARLAARHQSAHRLLEDSAKTLERSEAEAEEARGALAAAEEALATANQTLETATASHESAAVAAVNAESALANADSARAEAQALEAEARAERSEAEGEAGALRAEAGALAKLVERDVAEGGQVLDLIRVKPGHEKSLGAALAEDLHAPAIDNDGRSGWATLKDYPKSQDLPAGVTALSSVADAPDVLARRISQIGLVDAADGPRLQAELQPGQRLVSAEGDLWRWDGFRAGAEDAPSAAALRMQQLNRLEELKGDLAGISARANEAAKVHDARKTRLAELTEADHAAREARREADLQLAEASRSLSRAEANRDIAASKLESLRMAVARHEEEAQRAMAGKADAENSVAMLDDLEGSRTAVEAARATVEEARSGMLARRATYDELLRAGKAREERQKEVATGTADWQQRLENAGQRMKELAHRKSSAEAELESASGMPAKIAGKREEMADAIEEAKTRNRSAVDELAVAETALRKAESARREADQAAGSAREARAASEARLEAAEATVKAAAGRIDEAQGMTPEALLEHLDVDPGEIPSAEKVEHEVNKLRQKRDALGAVNLRAEEDARDIREEHDNLMSEKTDLEEAVRKLRTGINTLNREGRERLLAAFEQVNGNFTLLFTHLFGGGNAKLEMVESDDPLQAGLEIMCQPPGKKLASLSLLSGGEQTLTALALIFAVFLANPAPICVLDEVDAPLDDANVARFCDLLDEMTRRTETRFLIITHHAVTMSRMDRLFGVTMGEQGVSQLVSVDLKKAEQMVA